MATKKVDLKSDEVRELLGTSPAWLVRWGSALLLLILVVFLVLAFLIRYPLSIQFPVSNQNSATEIPILAVKDGTIKFWLVEQGTKVSKDQAVSLQANQADYLHVLALQERLERFDASQPSSFKDFGDLDDLDLGQLEQLLNAFRKSLEPVKTTSGHSGKDYNFKKRQAKALEDLLKDLEKDLPQKRNAANAWERSFLEARAAYSSGSIDLDELQRIQDFSKKADSDYQNLQNEVQKRKADLNRVNKELSQMSGGTTVMPPKESDIVSAFNALENGINNWLADHLVLAPASGEIAFDTSGVGSFSKGDSMGYLIVDGANDINLVGTAILPGNFSKEEVSFELINENGESIALNAKDVTIQNKEGIESEISITISQPSPVLKDFLENSDNKGLKGKLTYGDESFLKRLWKDFGKLN
ncbi:MAG: hypothetical protein KDC24_09915 [Saprospiraceae bacterium]|nr:hypothetical protein [Saprospiraceae bacterium]